MTLFLQMLFRYFKNSGEGEREFQGWAAAQAAGEGSQAWQKAELPRPGAPRAESLKRSTEKAARASFERPEGQPEGMAGGALGV